MSRYPPSHRPPHGQGPAVVLEPPGQAPPPGYVSREARTYLITGVCIAGGIVLALKIVVPMVVSMLMMPMAFSGGMQMAAPQLSSAAVWDGKLWYASSGIDFRKGMQTALVSRELTADAEPNQAAALSIAEPWLLAGSDRLWIVHENGLSCFADGKVTDVRGRGTPGRCSRPFLYDGQPAILKETTGGLGLSVFTDGQWRRQAKLRLPPGGRLGRTGEDVRAFQIDGQLHVFCRLPASGAVKHHRGLPDADAVDDDAWEDVATASGQWQAVALAGRPAVFVHQTGPGQPRIVGYRRESGQWQEFFSRVIGADIGMGVCPTGQGEQFLVLRRIPPLGAEALAVRNGSVAWRGDLGGGMSMPTRFQLLSLVPQSITLLLSGVLAVIIALLMSKYRTSDYARGEAVVEFASVLRRGVAAAIDLALVAGPIQAISLAWYSDLTGGSANPWRMLSVMWKLFCGGTLWLVGTYLLFSFLEGATGRTPGKWVAGIRVVRADLSRCGFGWALLRNLIRPVDMLFWYVPAMVLTALMPRRQRLGDLAAGTIVLRARSGPRAP